MSRKVALVTGAARGIGRAYVVALIERGWCVTLVDISGVEETTKELSKLGNDVQKRLLPITVDVTNSAQMESAFKKTISHFGGFDLLVNNAGIFNQGFEKLEQTFAINLISVAKSTEWAIKYATNGLKKRSEKPFLIVNTASVAGLIPLDMGYSPIYTASKFGIVGMVRSLKFMAPKFNVRVNCICPFAVATGIVGEDSALRRIDNLDYINKEGRGGIFPPEEIAKALLKIIDDESIAGEAVVVHSSVGIKVEPSDPHGQFSYLGKNSFQSSKEVENILDFSIQQIVKTGKGWSSL